MLSSMAVSQSANRWNILRYGGGMLVFLHVQKKIMYVFVNIKFLFVYIRAMQHHSGFFTHGTMKTHNYNTQPSQVKQLAKQVLDIDNNTDEVTSQRVYSEQFSVSKGKIKDFTLDAEFYKRSRCAVRVLCCVCVCAAIACCIQLGGNEYDCPIITGRACVHCMARTLSLMMCLPRCVGLCCQCNHVMILFLHNPTPNVHQPTTNRAC